MEINYSNKGTSYYNRCSKRGDCHYNIVMILHYFINIYYLIKLYNGVFIIIG